MPTPGQELSTLDFESMIGGPLIAVVHAQSQAALATVDFIKQVGFKPTTTPGLPEEQTSGEPATITFKYKKKVPKDDGSGDDIRDTELTVPFLAMLPIPYLRVEETNIDFLAKINSVEYRQVDTNFKLDASLSARAGWGWGSAKLKVSTTYQRQTKEGSTVTRDYSMGVKVKAVQEEMPGGLERLLGILESLIEEKTTT
jgi:hypothetical protein